MKIGVNSELVLYPQRVTERNSREKLKEGQSPVNDARGLRGEEVQRTAECLVPRLLVFLSPWGATDRTRGTGQKCHVESRLETNLIGSRCAGRPEATRVLS